MRTRLTLIVVTTVMALAISGMASAAPAGGPNAPADTTNDYVMVTLPSPAAASYQGGIPGLARTKPERGRLDTSSPAYAAYRRHLDNEHANFRASLDRVAPGAEIVREYHNVLNGFAVKLNGNSMAAVSRAQGAAIVDRSWLYQPTMNVSTDLINADDVWGGLGGQATAGAGIKVGVIDTGIVEGHVFFQCKGDPDVLGDGISHKVYASGEATPTGLPAIVFDHGTHVAGTIGGCVTAGDTVSPITVDGNLSGVAPGAELYDYNVFPGFGAGFVAFGGSAFSHDIAAAIEDALADGMDVVNMSLGGGVQGPHDFLADASNAAVDAGMVVVVAAGNSGSGDSTVESPGSAAKVITAGASTNSHLAGVPVTVVTTEPASSVTYVGAAGDFGPYGTPFSGVLVDVGAVTSDFLACSPIEADLTDTIALIDRGGCTFTTKVRNAENAGAIGVIVANSAPGPAVSMAHDGTEPKPGIVAVMVSNLDGAAIRTGGLGTATIGGSAAELPAEANVLAGFSSRGPTPFTYLIKPDVVAPGVNIYSSVFDNQFAFFQGTSMATPHVTGSVALLLDANVGWSPAQVKSALVNYANEDILTGLPSDRAKVLQIGGGLVDLAAADGAAVFLDPVSISFGRVNGNTAASASVTVAVSGSGTCDVDDGSTLIVSPETVSSNSSVTFTLDGGKAGNTPSGDYSGYVTFDCGGTEVLAPWFVRIDRQGKP